MVIPKEPLQDAIEVPPRTVGRENLQRITGISGEAEKLLNDQGVIVTIISPAGRNRTRRGSISC